MTLSTFLFVHMQTLNKKIKTDGQSHEIFFEKVTGT